MAWIEMTRLISARLTGYVEGSSEHTQNLKADGDARHPYMKLSENGSRLFVY